MYYLGVARCSFVVDVSGGSQTVHVYYRRFGIVHIIQGARRIGLMEQFCSFNIIFYFFCFRNINGHGSIKKILFILCIVQLNKIT